VADNLTRERLDLLIRNRDSFPEDKRQFIDDLAKANNTPKVDRTKAYYSANSYMAAGDTAGLHTVIEDTLREVYGVPDADIGRLAKLSGYKDSESFVPVAMKFLQNYAKDETISQEEWARQEKAAEEPGYWRMLRIDAAGQIPGGATPEQESERLKKKAVSKVRTDLSMKHFVQTTNALRRQLKPETTDALDYIALAKETDTKVDAFMSLSKELSPEEFGVAYQYLTMHIPQIDRKKWRSSFMRGVDSMVKGVATAIELEYQALESVSSPQGLYRTIQLDGDKYFDGDAYRSEEAKAELRDRLVKEEYTRRLTVAAKISPHVEGVVPALVDRAEVEASVDSMMEKAPAMFREGAEKDREFLDRKRYYDEFKRKVEKTGFFLGDTFNEFLEMAPHTAAVGLLGAAGNAPAALMLSYSQIQPDMELRYRQAGMSAKGAHQYSKLFAPLAVSLDYVGAMAATSGTGSILRKKFAEGMKKEILPIMGIVLKEKGIDYVEEVLTEGGQKLVEDMVLVYADRYAHINGISSGEMADEVLEETLAAARSMWWMTAGPAGRDLVGATAATYLEGKNPVQWLLNLDSEIQQRNMEARKRVGESDPFFIEDKDGGTWAVNPETAVRYLGASTEDERASIVQEVMETNLDMTEDQALQVLGEIESNGSHYAKEYTQRIDEILANMGVRVDEDPGAPDGQRRNKGVTTAIEDVIDRMRKRFASGKNVTVRTHGTVALALEDPDIDDQTKEALRRGERIQAFESNGTVVFISENMDSRGEAIAKFAHEVLAHGSIKDLGSDKSIDAFLSVLDRVGIRAATIKKAYEFFTGISGVYKAQFARKIDGRYVDDQGNEVSGPDEAAMDERAVADELIARISEKLMNGETLDIQEKKLAEKMRDWLWRSIGAQTAAEWTNQEIGTIVRNLMRGDVDSGKVQGDAGTRFTVAPPVESDEFKSWFGDYEDPNAYSSKKDPEKKDVSMVVNPDGTPMVVYHSTDKQFDEFSLGVEATRSTTFGNYTTKSAGIFFSESKSDSEAYGGRTIEAYLDIKYPLDLTREGTSVDQDFLDELEANGINPRWFYYIQNTWELFDGEEGEALVEALSSMGYDGVTFEDENPDTRESFNAWMAFSPDQVRQIQDNTRYSSGRDLSGSIGTGRGYTDFFGNFHEAQGDEWFFPHGEYEPAIKLEDGPEEFQQVRGKHMGNFDLHIATSIPGFSDLQAIVGDALVESYGQDGAHVLDIGASEGALVKALAELSAGNITSVALDPNPKMKATFMDKGRVDGVEYRLEALGDMDVRGKYAWSEIDKNTGIATQIKFFDPGDRRFDVVHEAMVFQFMSNQRDSQMAIVKEMMAGDGVAIFEEKFAQADVDQYNANEDKKDYDWKSKYYTEEQIERKRREVLEKGGDTIEGMTKMQVTVEEMHGVLAKHFGYFAQFWDSGNFMGFIASDSREALQRVLDNMQDTTSDYSNNKTGEVMSKSKYSVAETRRAQAVHELLVMNVPLRTDGKLQLTHWSPVPGITSLEPAEFGSGPVRGRERDRAGLGFVNRVQFGLAGYHREIDPGHRYMASVDPADLYPLLRDPLNLREQARPVRGNKGDGTPIYGDGVDINKYEQLIQEAGYKGFISRANFGPVVAMFEPVKVESVVENDTTSYAPVEVDAQGRDALKSWNYLQNLGYIGGLVFRRAGSPDMEDNNLPKYSVSPRKVDALGFYSPIRAEVEAMDFKQIPPRQLSDRIRKLPKQEEMEDLGLYDWLDLQEGKVSKESVLAFIDQGGVQLNQIINSDEEAEANTPEFNFGIEVQDEHDEDFIREIAEENYDDHVAAVEGTAIGEALASGEISREEFLEETVIPSERRARDEDLGYTREVEVDVGDKTFTFQWAWNPNDGHEIYSKDFDENVIPGQFYPNYLSEVRAEMVITDFLRAQNEIQDEEGSNETQHGQYVMEGPSNNYREFILTLPSTRGVESIAMGDGIFAQGNTDFTHPHWPGIQNPLVHFRTTDRQVDGKDALFLEEIQSDWIQQGRKKGFQRPPTEQENQRISEIYKETEAINDRRLELENQIRELDQPGGPRNPELRETLVKEMREQKQRAQLLFEEERLIRDKSRKGEPDPGAFKRSGTVDLLAFKRALAIAVAEDKDAIAWTPAIEQIRRWSDSLQQEVRSISWSPGSSAALVLLEQAQANIKSWQETLKETRQARELAFRMNDMRGVTANDVTIERLVTAITEAKIEVNNLKKQRTQPSVVVKTINAYPGNDLILFHDRQGVITGYEGAFGRGDELLGKTLSEVFDNSIQKQILESPEGKLEGEGLTIGGKGFKDFYDGLLPREVQKYVKKMGGRVGVGKVELGELPGSGSGWVMDAEDASADPNMEQEVIIRDERTMDGVHDPFNSIAEAEEWWDSHAKERSSVEVWSVQITDKMRDEVSMGQPRYSIRNGGEQGSVLEGVEIDEDKWRASSDTRYSFGSILGVDDPPFIDFRELNGLDKFVFGADRTRVGPYVPIHSDSNINITLQGGPAYPFDPANAGRSAWAVTAGSQAATSMGDRAGKVGLITLYARENLVKNETFTKVYMAEVREAIERGELSKTRFLRVANQLRVAAKRRKGLNGKPYVTGKWAELWRTDWRSLEEMEFALRASTFDVRGSAFFSHKPDKKGANKFQKIGSDDRISQGFPDVNKIVEGMVDPNFDHLPYGIAVGAIEIGGAPVHAGELGVPVHDSYSAAIPGKGIGLLKQPIPIIEIVDDEAGRTGWLHTKTHTSRMSPANDKYSVGEKRNPLTEATVDLALRILEGKNLNRRQAEMVINRYYRGADPTTAIFRAHKLAAQIKPEWADLEDSTDRAIARIRAGERVMGHAERAQEAYDALSSEFKAKYLQGRMDQTLAASAARRNEKALAKEKALKANELEEEDLLINDPVSQLDVEEELRKEISRKKQEEEEAGVEQEENPEVTEEDIEAVVSTPKAIPEYLSKLKAALERISGLKQGTPEFLVAYRQTLANALDTTIRSLTYGRTRESLLRRLERLDDITTEKGLDRRASAILWNAFQQGARDGRKEAVSKFQKMFRRRLKNKLAKKTGSWTKDPIDKTKARMFKFMLDVSRLKPEEVREMQEDLQTEMDNGLEKFYSLEKDKRGLVADEIADLQMKLELLDRYGALPYKTLAQINEAVETAMTDLDAAFEEQKARIDQRKDIIQGRRDMIIDALMSAKGRVKRTDLSERIEAGLSIYPMSLHSLLQDMIRFASPKLHSKLWNDDVRAEGQVWSLKQLSKDILTRQANIRERKRQVHMELIEAIQQIYGVNGRLRAQAKLAQLMKANEAYRKYSKEKNPRALSKASLMQMIAYMEQDFYRENAENHGRLQDYDAIRAELSEEDYALIEWMREFYRGNRKELSDKKREITGLGFPVEMDDNYMPVGIQDYGGFRGLAVMLQLTPGIYADRRHHTKDIDEKHDIFSLFFDRNHKNAVYLELAELSLDIAEIFGDTELQQTMSEVYGSRYTDHLMQMLFDTMSQKPLRQDLSGISNVLLNYGALVMTFNLASASRQPASAWEFGLDMKDMNMTKGELEGLRKRAGRRELAPFIAEMFRSDHAAARFDAGQSYEIATAFESEGMTALKSWINKWGMAPNKLMDLITIATVGARTYRFYYQHMIDVGMDEEQARKAAMEWTWAEAETHQQSSFVSNQAPWQRGGDTPHKLLGMFSSTPQQFLSIQNQLYRQAKATGNWKPFIRSAIIHHVLGPATYKLIDTAFQLALGRPPDEDEWKEWAAFMLLGPYSGGFVYRFILAWGIDKMIGNKSGVFGIDLIPAERGIEVMGDMIDMLKALLVEGDVDKALGEANDVLSTFQPYNYAATIKENYIDQ
jgi:hypothetical protein